VDRTACAPLLTGEAHEVQGTCGNSTGNRGCGAPGDSLEGRAYGRIVFFLDVFVNNNGARDVYKAFAFRKEETMRDPSDCRAEG
jgi:hypothetical protein